MRDNAPKPLIPKPGPRRRRRLVMRLGLGLLFLAVAAGVAWSVWDQGLAPPRPGSREMVSLTVAPGASCQEIAQLLESKGLIRNRVMWTMAASKRGYTQRFQAGDFDLSPGMHGLEIMQALTHGTVSTISVTIPEGYTLEQIARTVARDTGLCTATEFVEVATNPAAWPELSFPPPPTGSLEGYLFPDTYAIDRDATAEEIVAQMVRRLEQELAKLRPDLEASNLTVHELLTLASIVEREIRVPEERPIGAQVFLKRLELGMKLESCATVQYLLDEPKEVLLIEDTRIDSPYNTYLYPGLPPGPIGSPGLSCIEAVLHPSDTDYLYFRTQGEDGRHHFSTTFAEHEAAGS